MVQLSQSIGKSTSGGPAAGHRNASIDTLRILAAIVVVAAHSNFVCDGAVFACLSTVNGSFRLAVPIFLLISGYYFYSALKADRHWTWVLKIARLYAVWMTIYSPFWLFDAIWQNDIGDIPENLVFGYFHLWYVAAVGGAALMTVFMSRFGLRWMMLAALVLFGFGVLLQYALNYGFLPDRLIYHAINGWLQRNFIFFGFPLFAIGFIIAAMKLETRVSRNLALGVLASGLVLLILEVSANYLAAGKMHVFEIYATVIVGAPALLILALKTNWQGGPRVSPKFAEAIFFVHVLVLNALVALVDAGSGALMVLCLAITLPLAAGLVWLDQQVKGVFL
nr:acyltransferase family protein [Hyphomonas sp.]